VDHEVQILSVQERGIHRQVPSKRSNVYVHGVAKAREALDGAREAISLASYTGPGLSN
jgi:hypothetical protein